MVFLARFVLPYPTTACIDRVVYELELDEARRRSHVGLDDGVMHFSSQNRDPLRGLDCEAND
jgi:hypothetical protein